MMSASHWAQDLCASLAEVLRACSLNAMSLRTVLLLLFSAHASAAPKKVPQGPVGQAIVTLADCALVPAANASANTQAGFPPMTMFAVSLPAAAGDMTSDDFLPPPDIEGLPIDPGTDMAAFTVDLSSSAGG